MADETDGAVALFLKRYGILGLILGFMVWAYYNPSAQSDFQSTIIKRLDTVEQENRGLRKSNVELQLTIVQAERDVVELERQMTLVQARLVTLQTAQDSLPWAAWLKDTDGTMLWANASYEESFLVGRGFTLDDYIGKTDFDVWPKEVAETFRANDQMVMMGKSPYVFFEKLPDSNGEMVEVPFVKYRRTTQDGIVVGIAGQAIPDPDKIMQWMKKNAMFNIPPSHENAQAVALAVAR